VVLFPGPAASSTIGFTEMGKISSLPSVDECIAAASFSWCSFAKAFTTTEEYLHVVETALKAQREQHLDALIVLQRSVIKSRSISLHGTAASNSAAFV
jgi:hypothetical protein